MSESDANRSSLSSDEDNDQNQLIIEDVRSFAPAAAWFVFGSIAQKKLFFSCRFTSTDFPILFATNCNNMQILLV